MKTATLPTAAEEDFVPVRSLDELRVLEPGTRVKIDHKDIGFYDILCFEGIIDGEFYSFLPRQTARHGISREGWLGENFRFYQDGTFDFIGIPFRTKVYSSINVEEYKSLLELLKKARLHDEGDFK